GIIQATKDGISDPGLGANFDARLAVAPSAWQVMSDLGFNAFFPGGNGSITGVVYNDSNSNGVKDGAESGIGESIGFFDANNNNAFDAGETTATTDASGQYIFTNLSPGAYHVRQVLKSGYRKTQPGSGVPGYDTTVSGGTIGGKNFGVTTNILLAGTVYN